jgi:hypothetical protein
MAASSRFWLSFIALLGLPAALALNGGANLAQSLRYLPLNYLWLAFPHLVLALLAVSPIHRRASLLLGLAALNSILVAFWLWVRLSVPAHESGLAWVLYLPLGGAEIAAMALAGLVLRRRRNIRTVGA